MVTIAPNNVKTWEKSSSIKRDILCVNKSFFSNKICALNIETDNNILGQLNIDDICYCYNRIISVYDDCLLPINEHSNEYSHF